MPPCLSNSLCSWGTPVSLGVTPGVLCTPPSNDPLSTRAILSLRVPSCPRLAKLFGRSPGTHPNCDTEAHHLLRAGSSPCDTVLTSSRLPGWGIGKLQEGSFQPFGSAGTGPPVHPITSSSQPCLGQVEIFGASDDKLPGVLEQLLRMGREHPVPPHELQSQPLSIISI